MEEITFQIQRDEASGYSWNGGTIRPVLVESRRRGRIFAICSSN
jgi:hypothetical protein